MYLQVYSNTPFAQVIDPQDTRNQVPPQVVKDQNLPDRIAIAIQDRTSLRCQPLRSSILRRAIFRALIEIEDLLYGSFVISLVLMLRPNSTNDRLTYLPIS